MKTSHKKQEDKAMKTVETMVILVKVTITERTCGWRHVYYITEKGIFLDVKGRLEKLRETITQFERRIVKMYGDNWGILYEGGFMVKHIMRDISEMRKEI